MTAEEAQAAASVCPTAALAQGVHGLVVDYARCVHCHRCLRSEMPASWDESYEWAAVAGGAAGAGVRPFKRSLHVRYLDSGACGACMGEVGLLDSPRYNFHRLGIFFTPTPRKADLLLVAGPVTENMRAALVAAYEAMPEPKIVVAMGVCAIDGGVFGRTFAVCGGAEAAVPVDVVIPGCPPPPLAVIHGLLVATGRAAAVSTTSEAREP
jgi:Ni,Fe-hydrogenase III small subunit